jgi:O-antigen/teichoic acid export membrane protein
LVLGRVLATLSEALVPLLVVRLLGKADVGLLSGTLLTYATVALICTSGLPEAVTFFLSTRPLPERRAIARRAALTTLGMGSVAAAILVLLSLGARWFGADEPSATGTAHASTAFADVWLLALYPIGEVPARLLPNLLVAEGRAATAARFGVTKALGGSLAALVPLALGAPVAVVLLSIAGFGLCYGAAVLWLLKDVYRDVPVVPSPVSARELLRFGVPLSVTDMVSLLNNQLDRYLILLLLPITALAEYQSGAWQIPVLTTIPYTVVAAYAPHLVGLFRAGKAREAIALWRGSALKVSLIVVPVTMVFLVGAEEAMTLLFTEAYVPAANVFRCYTFMTLLRVTAFGTLLVAMGRPGLVFRAAVFALVSNLLFSVPLALWLGFLGPALGTALAFIPMLYYYCHCIAAGAGVRTSETFPLVGYLRVLAIALVAAVPAALFKYNTTLHAGWSLAAEAVIVLGGFAALGTLLRVIQREDWRYLKNWLRFRLS